MPDKAIDVVDEAGARLRLKPVDERETDGRRCKHIEDVVARMARIPAEERVAARTGTCCATSSAI